MIIRATEKSVRAKAPTEVFLDETRDEAHLNARGATQGKYK
jgi:hypothetical protein